MLWGSCFAPFIPIRSETLRSTGVCEWVRASRGLSTSEMFLIYVSATHSFLPLGIPPRTELLSPPTSSLMTHFRSFHTSAPENLAQRVGMGTRRGCLGGMWESNIFVRTVKMMNGKISPDLHQLSVYVIKVSIIEMGSSGGVIITEEFVDFWQWVCGHDSICQMPLGTFYFLHLTSSSNPIHIYRIKSSRILN